MKPPAKTSKVPYHGKGGRRWQRGKVWNGRMWVAANRPARKPEGGKS